MSGPHRLRRAAGLSAVAASTLVTAVLGPVGAARAAGTQIAADSFTQSTCKASTTTNHQANVEPDTFAAASTIVAAFQVGRIYDGGACAIGFATSTDSGTTWTNGLLPGITKYAGAGKNDRATDASVAYDAAHGVWLVSSLTLLESGGVHGNSVVTSRSADGKTWESTPRLTVSGGDLDKNWIVCDNTSSSAFYGHCYTEWDDHGNGNKMQMSTSTDGGQTWSGPATNGAGIIGGQPVVQPSGTVVVPTANANETAIGAYQSTDGGAHWTSVTTIATIKHHTVAGSLREGPLPSAEVDGNGKVYVAWSDCRFRRSCKTNDIVYSSSTNGTSWSAVTRVPIDATNSGVDHFIPGLAVDPTSSGASAKLGLTYYFYPQNSTQLSVGYISSTNGGANWSPATTVTSGMSSTWAASTSQGRMVGDYISTSFSNGVAHGVYGAAHTPTTGTSTACTTSALDNCDAPIEQYSAAAASGTASAATGPILFTGNGGGNAASLWNLVDNNGSKHRD